MTASMMARGGRTGTLDRAARWSRSLRATPDGEVAA